jgi:hypothetical protein
MHGSPDPDPHQNVMDPEHCLVVTYTTIKLLLVALILVLKSYWLVQGLADL